MLRLAAAKGSLRACRAASRLRFSEDTFRLGRNLMAYLVQGDGDALLTRTRIIRVWPGSRSGGMPAAALRLLVVRRRVPVLRNCERGFLRAKGVAGWHDMR